MIAVHDLHYTYPVAVTPAIRSLDFDSQLKAVSDNDLLHKQVGEDWLLFLEPR